MKKHRWFAVLFIFMFASCSVIQTPTISATPLIEIKTLTLQPASPNPITTETATFTSSEEIKSDVLPTETSPVEIKTPPTPATSTGSPNSPVSDITHNLNIDIPNLSLLDQFKYYILYDKDDEIHALSMDGVEDIIIGKGDFQSVTFDGKILGTSGSDGKDWEFFDFETHKIETKSVFIPKTEPEDCRLGTVSPNQKWATVLCTSDEKHLFLENLDDHRVIPVPGNSPTILSLFWSTDGRRFIYVERNVNLFPEHFSDGSGEIMLVDVSCLDSPDPCPLKTDGPYHLKNEPIYGMGPQMGSPDGQYYAFPTGSYVLPIITFDLRNKSFSKINVGDNDYGIDGMAWSPDGQWIACSLANSQISQISLVSVKDSKTFQLINGHKEMRVIGWLSTFPRPVFQIKNYLFITGAGDNLNVRESPSVKSALVNKLYSEDQIQIIDGPIKADDITWWKILVLKDQSKGWVAENPNWYATSKK